MLSIKHIFYKSITSPSFEFARSTGRAAQNVWQALTVVPMFLVMVFALALGSVMAPRSAWADLGDRS